MTASLRAHLQGEHAAAPARYRRRSHSVYRLTSRRIRRPQVPLLSCICSDNAILINTYSVSRQRSVTSSGFVPDVGNGSYRMESVGGSGAPQPYDYNTSDYNSWAPKSVAQRRVNSEGELLAYHRGEEATHPNMNYSVTGLLTRQHRHKPIET